MASVEKNTRTPLGTRLPKRQHAQRKGNIGCHGDGPAVVRASMVKDQVDAGGNDDAAHGRQHGKHGLTRILELADRHLY